MSVREVCLSHELDEQQHSEARAEWEGTSSSQSESSDAHGPIAGIHKKVCSFLFCIVRQLMEVLCFHHHGNYKRLDMPASYGMSEISPLILHGMILGRQGFNFPLAST